jgi:hypothetical protein
MIIQTFLLKQTYNSNRDLFDYLIDLLLTFGVVVKLITSQQLTPFSLEKESTPNHPS